MELFLMEAVRGIAGGTTSGATYLGTVVGSRDPPGIAAARTALGRMPGSRSPPGSSRDAPVTAPALSNWRLVSMVPSLRYSLFGAIRRILLDNLEVGHHSRVLVLQLVAVDYVEAPEGVEADQYLHGLAVFQQHGVLPPGFPGEEPAAPSRA